MNEETFREGDKVIVVRPFHPTNRHVGEVLETGLVPEGPDRGQSGCHVHFTDVTDPHAPRRFWIPSDYLRHHGAPQHTDDGEQQP